jgi:hypothetical protein
MALRPAVEGLRLKAVAHPFGELLEGPPAVLGAQRWWLTSPDVVLDDRQLGGSVEMLGPTSAPPALLRSDEPEPPGVRKPPEVLVDAAERSAAMGLKESGWAHFLPEELSDDFQADRVGENDRQAIEL